MTRALLVAGLAAALYVIAAWSVAPGFYDGFGPQAPYRWVSPPPQFQHNNQPPLSGQATIRVNPGGVVDAGSVFTQDGQASISFTPGAFQAPTDDSPVTIQDECGRETTGKTATFNKAADTVAVDGNEQTRTATRGCVNCP